MRLLYGGKRKRRRFVTARFGLIAAWMALMLTLQACGAGGGDTGGGSGGTAVAGNAGGEAGTAEPADDVRPSVPKVLNYGYIGANELNVPGGAEGWGFYKGIIQAELKKYGIEEVKLTGFPNGPDQSESLIGGRLDFGSLGDTPAILARSTGAKTRLITQGSADNVGYLIAAKNGPKTLAELAGKTIAIQKGSFMHRYIAGLLKQEGIKDVKLIHMLRPDGEAALARGEVDAMTNSGINALKLIEQGFPKLDDATAHPDLYGSSVTVVSEAYLEKFPDFPKVWNEARLKALEDLKRHPDEYYEFLAKQQKTEAELVKQVTPIEKQQETPFTEAGSGLLDGTKAFLVEEKLAKKDFELQDWILEVK